MFKTRTPQGYLAPLWRYAASRGATLRLGCRAVRVGRAGVRKGDMAGRAGKAFQVLVESLAEPDAAASVPKSAPGGVPEGVSEGTRESVWESVLEADCVADCTGSFGQRCWLGPGGLPACGERRCLGAIAGASSLAP